MLNSSLISISFTAALEESSKESIMKRGRQTERVD